MTRHPSGRERRRSDESTDSHGARTRIEAMAIHPEEATVLRRAQALLWRDEGESIADVSERLGVSQRTICYWQAHFRERPLVDLAARLRDGHRSGRPRTATRRIEPLL